MQVSECYVNRYDPCKVYKVLAIEGKQLRAEQCFCRPDGMEISTFVSTMAYRLKDPQIRPETYERIRQQIQNALKTTMEMVKSAETWPLMPELDLEGMMREWGAEPEEGDFIVAFYEGVTTLFHVSTCNGHKVSGEYIQVDPTYVEHDKARAFDLPDDVRLIDENVFAKIPKLMSMTEAVMHALIKNDLK